jgi:CRISPR-associated endonuclease Cas2
MSQQDGGHDHNGPACSGRFVLVAYDIHNNAIRARAASLLSRYGNRVQESVFRLPGGPKVTRRITRALEGMMNPTTDRMLVVGVCAACAPYTINLAPPHAVTTTNLGWLALV